MRERKNQELGPRSDEVMATKLLKVKVPSVRNTSGVTGVSRNSATGKWEVYITLKKSDIISVFILTSRMQ